jgi:hypothetical protein
VSNVLEKVKLALRIKSNALDDDINDDIQAAKKSLKVAGVVFTDEKDPLIIKAIKFYCKAQLETDSNKAEKYMNCFENLKEVMTLSSEYNK